jgi:hypothetical protein
MNQYWKSIISAAATGLAALYFALNDGTVTTQEWVGIAISALGTVGVWAKSNADPPLPEIPGRHELKEDV